MFTSLRAIASLALVAASVRAAPVAVNMDTTLATIAKSLVLPTTVQNNTVEWYAQNGNMGACGVYSSDSDLVVGLPTEFYYDLDSVSTYCGAYIVITNPINGVNVTARVEDASAANETLSVSIATWAALDGDDTDLTEVSWVFADKSQIAAATASSSSSSAPVAKTSSASQAAYTTSAKPYTTTTTPYYSPKPTTTTQAYYSPKPTTTTTTSYKPKTTTTTKAAESTKASYSSSSSSSSKTYSGQATFYTQNGVEGACGSVSSDSSYIVAIDSAMYSGGSNCGRQVHITASNGKTVTATVKDECPTCASSGSLDLSVGAFTQLTTEDAGVIGITWYFTD